MNEITSRIDMNTFSKNVGLTPDQTIERVQELANSGLVSKRGGGYGITEKGKAILKAITPIPKETAFHFYTAVGQPTGFSAESIKEFYEIVKRVPEKSLEFHLYRGDFENWVKAAFEDETLAAALISLKNADIKGEELRQRMLKTVLAKYGF
jgi:DNA-binding Lrp family transcriptional regulator